MVGGAQLICTVAVLVRRFRFRMAADAPPVGVSTPLPPTGHRRLLMLPFLSGRDDHGSHHSHHQRAAHGDESKGGCSSGGGTGAGIDHCRGSVAEITFFENM